MSINPNPICSKSFVVGRPIEACVSRYDTVTLNVTLTDDRGNIIDLTGCSMVAFTSDTECHMWEVTVTDAKKGKFTFTFQPLVVGPVVVNVDIMKTVGEDTYTTTFYIGTLSVAYEESEPQEHIISLTEKLIQAYTACNAATAQALAAAATVASASIDVGTVTTGPTPAITKRGTPLNPIFDFVLARGDKGDKGDKGDVMFATFHVDPATGVLIESHDTEYKGATFRLNNSILEVMV